MKQLSEQNLVYCRMAGYVVTILMHTINVSVMLYGFRGDVFKDPNIQVFYYFMDKFITCWTFTIQSIHAVLGLSCDILSLMTEGQKEHRLHRFMKHIRNVLFASIVVPYTFAIATSFWPIFLYNRELILPTFTTRIVGSVSNHVMHSAIVPATLWEMAFQPREQPQTHMQNAATLTTFTLAYFTVIFSTYFEKGQFPYPVMNMLFGSFYFIVLMAAAIAWLPFFYYGQWVINDLLWRRNNRNIKKVC